MAAIPAERTARPRKQTSAETSGPAQQRERDEVTDHLSEHDEVTPRVLAIRDRTTVAEQRRQALRGYAQQARQDTRIAEVVRLILASRRKRNSDGGNVISLRASGR